eukprot:m.189378 g.189378  ORF g.189378 m.189378 type:complete len:396 (+) comp17715_c0_seq1:515-1702(+)
MQEEGDGNNSPHTGQAEGNAATASLSPPSNDRPYSRVTIESLLSESDDELCVADAMPNDRWSSSSKRDGKRKKSVSTSALQEKLLGDDTAGVNGVSPHWAGHNDDGAGPAATTRSTEGGGDDDGAQQEDEDDNTPAVGNRVLLYFAMISFSAFAVAELAAAILANSESLLGDSMTMMVDGVTYAVNIWAEKAKEGKSEVERIRIDTIAPAFSLLALVAVTIYITVDAVQRLDDNDPDSNEANAEVMWAFALVNLVLDFVNIAMFFIGKHHDGRYYASCHLCNSLDLNMMSAFAHVGADTLRSVAVLFAGIAADENYVGSDRADAVGAIVVSFAIALSCVPLILGLRVQHRELRKIRMTNLTNLVAEEVVGREYASGSTPDDAANDSLLIISHEPT